VDYEVCAVVVSSSLVRMDMYKTFVDYEKGRPTTIYVVFRKHPIHTIEKSEIYKLLKDADARVVVLEEEEATRVYNEECKRARKIITIPIL
jgi:hypothetical protein